jgi:hypothetical protein
MAFNSRLRADWFAYFDAHIDGVEAMVARDLRSRAATTWLKRFPKHRTVNLRYGTHAVHVLLR